jgi:hypothetical protein
MASMLMFTTSQMAAWKSAPRASCFPIAPFQQGSEGQPHRCRREQAPGPRSCHHQGTAGHVLQAEDEHEQPEGRIPETRPTDIRPGLRAENPCESCERRQFRNRKRRITVGVLVGTTLTRSCRSWSDTRKCLWRVVSAHVSFYLHCPAALPPQATKAFDAERINRVCY